MRTLSPLRTSLLLVGALGAGACDSGVTLDEGEHAEGSGASVCIAVGQGLRCRIEVPPDSDGSDTDTDSAADTAEPPRSAESRIRSGVEEGVVVGGRRSISVRVGNVSVIDGDASNSIDFRLGHVE